MERAAACISCCTARPTTASAKAWRAAASSLRPPGDAAFASQDTPIVGNTCLYGATGGELFAAGRAGERFGVRNSGALAVIEGVGDHGCEYMTGGTVVVLGRSGLNFGAGMTGGFAYVLDLERDFVDRYNHELVDINRISLEGMENHLQHLRSLLRAHCEHTGSAWGAQIAVRFPRCAAQGLAGQTQGGKSRCAVRRTAARGLSTMTDKLFPFLKFHRALPREVPVQIRVLDYREIYGEFSRQRRRRSGLALHRLRQSVLLMGMSAAQPHPAMAASWCRTDASKTPPR